MYDKEKKRARKITGKYLGSITEDGGFKESRKRVLERELEEARLSPSSTPAPAVKVGAVKEYAVTLYGGLGSCRMPQGMRREMLKVEDVGMALEKDCELPL